MVVIVTSSGLDTCGSVGDEPIVATITDEQRQEFGRLVEATIKRIESAQFLPHSGIRFPQNPCSSCPYIGLCLGRQDLVEAP